MFKKELISKYITPLSPCPTSLEKSGKLDKKIVCMLFDIYGTLFISGSGDIGMEKNEEQHIPLIASLLEEYGIPLEATRILEILQETIVETHKKRMEEGIDFPEVKIDEIWSEILTLEDMETVRKFAVCFEMIVNPVFPMPNLEKVLTKLKNKNIRMGIISNAQFYTPYLFDWFLGASIEELQFTDDLIFYSFKEGVAKPSFHMFGCVRDKLSDMSVPLDQVLYIGNDMRNDILPAKEAGFKTALFAGDERSLRLRNDISRCREIMPDLIITNLIQLLDFI